MKRRGNYHGGNTIIRRGQYHDFEQFADEALQERRRRPVASAPVKGERERDEQRLREINERRHVPGLADKQARKQAGRKRSPRLKGKR